MQKSIQIPSSLQHIHLIEEYIDTIRSEFQIDDSLYGNIHLAVVEAVTNAIVHGNKQNVEKDIFFCTIKDDKVIRFCVKDQGPGFDVTSIPDPTLPENREKISGRGVFLIRHLADDVTFRDNGATLEMSFHL